MTWWQEYIYIYAFFSDRGGPIRVKDGKMSHVPNACTMLTESKWMHVNQSFGRERKKLYVEVEVYSCRFKNETHSTSLSCGRPVLPALY